MTAPIGPLEGDTSAEPVAEAVQVAVVTVNDRDPLRALEPHPDDGPNTDEHDDDADGDIDDEAAQQLKAKRKATA